MNPPVVERQDIQLALGIFTERRDFQPWVLLDVDQLAVGEQLLFS